MSSRPRVTHTIDEGYNFDVEHKNWNLQLTWKEYFFLFLLMFLPTLVINLAYLLFRDVLLSQMLYQMLLIILPLIYKQFFPLNLDIHYIQYVKNMPGQFKSGICLFLFYLALIPGFAITLKYFGVNILEGMLFMMPSGLTPLSRFQRIVHIIYFMVLAVVFGVMAPIAEFRYYLVFLQSKFNDSKLTYFVMFLLLTLNSVMILMFIAAYKNINFLIFLACLIVLSNYRLLVVKAKEGIITTLLRQFGINFGVLLVMVLAIYTNYVVEKRKDISLFADKNALDMMLDGFIWDDPNYDSSF